MEQKLGIFGKLRQGLSKTRNTLFGDLFSGKEINEELYEELEDAMVMADMGVPSATAFLTALREQVKAQKLRQAEEARQALIEIVAAALTPVEPMQTPPAVLLIVGVNGVGKTTTAGKLAAYYGGQGHQPMLAAADTFRAAAAEQLEVWAKRANVPMVRHGEGADPAAVVFDAIASYRAKNCDVLLCDTAGRLHNKVNLMNELAKIRRVIERELPNVPCETLLVLDATTGQNAVAQAKAFSEATGLSGVILTKLDGTAKGGVVAAITRELQLPVRFVGVGEGVDDLQPFDAKAFAEAIF
ncbi:MAG: signal recognition particle-docking protein FtsY [Eubacteriales bacterium]|nr:signal recognition particle-docking protein FtsY [Eubacteriales bacterium]